MQYRNLYGNGYTRRAGKKKSSGLLRLLDILVFLLTVVVSAVLLMAYLAPFTDPARYWFFAFAGMISPILFAVNIILTLYWVIRWKWYVFIPLISILLGIGHLSLFFKPGISKHYKDIERTDIRLMTFNVMGFMDLDENGKMVSTLQEQTALILDADPDILCMQEFQARNEREKERIDQILGLPHNIPGYRVHSRNYGWGVAVYSKYPILRSEHIQFDNSTNSALWVDLKIGRDTVKLINCHLQTTSVDDAEKEFITNHEIINNPAGREEKVRGIASKLRRNFGLRALQADTLSMIIHNSPYPVIVCGDFNDTPMSYTYKKMKGGLKDSFVEKGKGLANNTFNGLFNIFRIDYILVPDIFITKSYNTVPSPWSDHKAVVVGLDFADK